MNSNERERNIDSDRTEGSSKQMRGGLKEKFGSLLGDEKMKREGQSEQAAGKIQNSWGSAKDSVREASGSSSS